jgi:4,5-DOPA dioxygenase extradiol
LPSLETILSLESPRRLARELAQRNKFSSMPPSILLCAYDPPARRLSLRYAELKVVLAMSERMPAIFFGHGNPMNAISRNVYADAWAAIGARLPRPRAVLSVSAHWFIPSTAVTAMAAPRTIHDFGGFPRELFEVQYPAPGHPELAGRVQELLAPLAVSSDHDWGLDHGTWSVLRHVFPDADIPVLQLSIDETQPSGIHYEIGRSLRRLRAEGVLIMGSGNIVHNLHAYAWGGRPVEPYEWAVRFEERARRAMETGEHVELIAYSTWGREASLSVPTPEHFLPLLYVLGAGIEGEPISFPIQGVDGGSVSMLSVQVG